MKYILSRDLMKGMIIKPYMSKKDLFVISEVRPAYQNRNQWYNEVDGFYLSNPEAILNITLKESAFVLGFFQALAPNW